MWGHVTMLWSESWEPGERGISDQMWAGALLSIESSSLIRCMLCAPGHFLEIGSMVEEGWDWTQWTNSIRMYQWELSQTSPNSKVLVMWPSHRTQNDTTPTPKKKMFLAKISLSNTPGVISDWLTVTADTGLTSSSDKTSYFVLGRGLMNCNNVLRGSTKSSSNALALMVGCINPQISP